MLGIEFENVTTLDNNTMVLPVLIGKILIHMTILMGASSVLGGERLSSILMEVLLDVEIVLVSLVGVGDRVRLLALGGDHSRVLLTSHDILEVGWIHDSDIASLNLGKLDRLSARA